MFPLNAADDEAGWSHAEFAEDITIRDSWFSSGDAFSQLRASALIWHVPGNLYATNNSFFEGQWTDRWVCRWSGRGSQWCLVSVKRAEGRQVVASWNQREILSLREVEENQRSQVVVPPERPWTTSRRRNNLAASRETTGVFNLALMIKCAAGVWDRRPTSDHKTTENHTGI